MNKLKIAFVVGVLIAWCVAGVFLFKTEILLLTSRSYSAAALVSPICLMLIWAVWVVIKMLVRAVRSGDNGGGSPN